MRRRNARRPRRPPRNLGRRPIPAFDLPRFACANLSRGWGYNDPAAALQRLSVLVMLLLSEVIWLSIFFVAALIASISVL